MAGGLIARPAVTTRRSAPTGSRRRTDGRAAAFFLLPSISGFLLFTVVPVIASLVLSFYEWPLIGKPVFRGVHNWIRLFTEDTVFPQVMLNTVYFVGAYIVGNLIVSLGLALWLTTKIRGRGFFRVVFFLPVVTPMVANAVIWRLIYTPNSGIADWLIHAVFGVNGPNWLGSPGWAMPALVLMSVWQGFGYNMMIFIAGLEAIPRSIREAAILDGTTAWQRLWRVLLPMLSPTVFFAVVMTLITSFQVFTQPYILTGGGPGSRTTTLVLYLYEHGFHYFDMGYASTIAWTLFVLIMFVTFIQFRVQRRWVHYE